MFLHGEIKEIRMFGMLILKLIREACSLNIFISL
jgi:hypothetical protein